MAYVITQTTNGSAADLRRSLPYYDLDDARFELGMIEANFGAFAFAVRKLGEDALEVVIDAGKRVIYKIENDTRQCLP